MPVFTCQDCDKRFDATEQTNSEQKFGQCPGCLSENIKEEIVKEDNTNG
jgi:Zn finger protein HypA/HybF involved in hydrogenase expression